MDKVASGDLTVQIPVRGRDELSQMAASLVGLRDKLVVVFTQLVHSSDRLGGATSNLTGIVSEVGQASEQQSSQMGSSTGLAAAPTSARSSLRTRTARTASGR